MLTKAQLHTLILSNLPDNGSNFISATLLRDVLDEMVDADFNISTNYENVGLDEYDESFSYPENRGVIYNGDIYQANTSNTTPGPFIPSEWDILTQGSQLNSYLLKDNGIELSAGKLIVELSDNQSLFALDTGFYQGRATNNTGLDQEYPTTGELLIQAFKGSSSSYSMLIAYPFVFDGNIYIRNLNSDWFNVNLGQAISSASNGLTKVGSDVQLGGIFSNVTLAGSGNSPFSIDDASINFYNNSASNNNYFALNDNNIDLRSNKFIRIESNINYLYGNTTQIGNDANDTLNVFSTPNFPNLITTSAFTPASEVILRDPSNGQLYAGSVNLFTGSTGGPGSATTVSAGPGIEVDQLLSDYTVSLSENFTGGTVDFAQILSGGTDLGSIFTGGTSGIEDAVNLGNGIGVFLQASGSTLEFKTLSGGTGVTITDDGEVLTLDSNGSAVEPNILDISQGGLVQSLQVADAGKTILNAGSPKFLALDYSLTSPADMFFLKGAITLSGNSGMMIYDISGNTTSLYTLNDDVPYVLHRFPKTGFNWRVVELGAGGIQTGESNTASNLGLGEGVFAQKSGVDLEFKSLSAGTNVTIDSSSDELTINVSGNTFDNGLTETAGNVQLGGPLTGPTTITAGSNQFNVSAGAGLGLYLNNQVLALGDGATKGFVFDGTNLSLSSTLGTSKISAGANKIEVGQSGMSFEVTPGNSVVTLSANTIEFNEIAEYDQDYSSSFTNNSLVTKKYVDDNSGGGGTGSTYTFENGLTETSGVVGLGGFLTGPTTINTGVNPLSIGNGPAGLSTLNGNDWSLGSLAGSVSVNSFMGSTIFGAGSNSVVAEQDNVRIEIGNSTFLSASGSNVNLFEIAEYDQDYTTSFTSESLVSKKYVDDAVAGGGGASLLTSFGLSSIATSSASANNVLALKFLCPANIEVNLMGIFVSSSANDTITLGIYDDQNNIITESSPTSTSGWAAGDLREIPVPTVQLVGGNTYWLAIKGVVGSLNFGTKATLTNAALCRASFFGSPGLPNTLGGSANSVAPFIYIKN